MTPTDTQGEGLRLSLLLFDLAERGEIECEDGGIVAVTLTAEQEITETVALSALPVPRGLEEGDVELLQRLRLVDGNPGVIEVFDPEDWNERLNRILATLREDLGRLGPKALHAEAEASGDTKGGAG